jgi:hypothetical protein
MLAVNKYHSGRMITDRDDSLKKLFFTKSPVKLWTDHTAAKMQYQRSFH